MLGKVLGVWEKLNRREARGGRMDQSQGGGASPSSFPGPEKRWSIRGSSQQGIPLCQKVVVDKGELFLVTWPPPNMRPFVHPTWRRLFHFPGPVAPIYFISGACGAYFSYFRGLRRLQFSVPAVPHDSLWGRWQNGRKLGGGQVRVPVSRGRGKWWSIRESFLGMFLTAQEVVVDKRTLI